MECVEAGENVGRRTSVNETALEIDSNWLLTDETKLQNGEIDDLADTEKSRRHNLAVDWFENRLFEVRAEVEVLYKQFKLSEALKLVYKLIWDDFCSWYLEWVKPGFEQPIDQEVYNETIWFFEELMQLLHPFMPFITEEIYHLLRPKENDLCVRQFDLIKTPDQKILSEGALLQQVISALRDARNKNGLKNKEAIKLSIQSSNDIVYKAIAEILTKQVNAESINYVQAPVNDATVVAVEKDKFYIQSEKKVDTAAIISELQKDLERQKGFLSTVLKKLQNEKFVANARPEVLELEKKKQADAEARINTIEESIANIA